MCIDTALPLSPKPRRGGMFVCSEDVAPTELWYVCCCSIYKHDAPMELGICSGWPLQYAPKRYPFNFSMFLVRTGWSGFISSVMHSQIMGMVLLPDQIVLLVVTGKTQILNLHSSSVTLRSYRIIAMPQSQSHFAKQKRKWVKRPAC